MIGWNVRWVSGPSVVLALILAGAWTQTQGNETDAAAAQTDPAATPDAPEDVTAQVRVLTTAPLRSDRSGRFVSGIQIENIGERDLRGRLVVVIDGTGIEGLSAALNSGTLASGEDYLEVLPLTAKLKPGEKTRSLRIEFTAEQPLDAQTRQRFALQTRVFRLGLPPLPDPFLPEPTEKDHEPLPGKTYSQARLNEVMQIQNKWTPALMEHEAVYGTATGEDEQGNLVVLVYTQRHGVIKDLPADVEGVPLAQRVTGSMFRGGPAWDRVIEINGRKKALGPPPPPEAEGAASPGRTANPQAVPAGPFPTDPTIRFPRPVPIGVSIFNRPDVCAAGTLGCRVVFQDGRLGILSNAHVIARESLAAVKEDLVNQLVGDDITQPGCLDGGSDVVNSVDIIAYLTDFQTFSAAGFNTIDAAVARIALPNNGLVLACTPGDGYGFPTRTPKQAVPGMRVKKYGRTTTYREGTIEGINSNLSVQYTRGVLFFVGQITIIGDHTTFGQPGDSGALIVTEQGNHPVALLFAGAGFQTAANPIQLVLDRFNIAIDDGSAQPPAGLQAGNSNPGAGVSGRAGGRVIVP